MASKRTHVRNLLTPALLFLVLSVIVCAEIPELLTLTENTTNDFTVRTTTPVDAHVFLKANNFVGIAGADSPSASGLLFPPPTPIEKVSLVPLKLFLLNSDLRR
jgi:hypothetical protein